MAKVKEVAVLLDTEFHAEVRKEMVKQGETWGGLVERLLREWLKGEAK